MTKLPFLKVFSLPLSLSPTQIHTPFLTPHTLSLNPHSSDGASDAEDLKKLISSYLGLSLSMFLALTPHKYHLHSRVRDLSARLRLADNQLCQMRSSRREDSNCLLPQHVAGRGKAPHLLIDAAEREMARLVERLDESEIGGRKLRLGFASWREMSGRSLHRDHCTFWFRSPPTATIAPSGSDPPDPEPRSARHVVAPPLRSLKRRHRVSFGPPNGSGTAEGQFGHFAVVFTN